ncbi:hypothetical protein PR048_000937 [Dryococelus australis]|uniref:Uncharacterized protein n=1 Tax=Dryococelus australis TaxID=614101 RepID=A0ABQ9IG18_9NEOP|nr:hypothetical protein PR048_000937 [Dryococelus australis]
MNPQYVEDKRATTSIPGKERGAQYASGKWKYFVSKGRNCVLNLFENVRLHESYKESSSHGDSRQSITVSNTTPRFDLTSLITGTVPIDNCYFLRHTFLCQPRYCVTLVPCSSPYRALLVLTILEFRLGSLENRSGLSEVSIEQHRNARVGGMGDHRENPHINVIYPARVPHAKIPGATPAGIEPGSSWWEVSSLTTAPPYFLLQNDWKNTAHKVVQTRTAIAKSCQPHPMGTEMRSTRDVICLRLMSFLTSGENARKLRDIRIPPLNMASRHVPPRSASHDSRAPDLERIEFLRLSFQECSGHRPSFSQRDSTVWDLEYCATLSARRAKTTKRRASRATSGGESDERECSLLTASIVTVKGDTDGVITELDAVLRLEAMAHLMRLAVLSLSYLRLSASNAENSGRSRREGAIRATLTRTSSASSLLRARLSLLPPSDPFYVTPQGTERRGLRFGWLLTARSLEPKERSGASMELRQNARVKKRETTEKTRQPEASTGMIPTYENSGAAPVGNRARFSFVGDERSNHYAPPP